MAWAIVGRAPVDRYVHLDRRVGSREHDKGLLLWDTGAPDAMALLPGGRTVNGPFTITVQRPSLRSLESMASIAAVLKQMGANLLIQHDLEQNRGLPHAPQALR